MKRIKQTVLDLIVADACDLFLSRSIESVTVRDVADKSGVGVATVYRYFSTKKRIVEKCALRLQKQVFEGYFKLSGENGYERLEKFYRGYLEIFKEHPKFYKFINEFDAYMIEEGASASEEFFNAYNDGVKDGSVKMTDNIVGFYYATTHAMLELCKKLSVNICMVRQDELVSGDTEINVLIGIILLALKV